MTGAMESSKGACDIQSLPDEVLAEVLALMGSAKDVCGAACVSRQMRRAADGAFRGLCHYTGRIEGSGNESGRCSSCPNGCPECSGDGRWRHLYFSSTFALAFNGMTSYLRLPTAALSAGRGGEGMTVEVLFRLPREAPACGVPSCRGGGALLSASVRPLGEATLRKPGRHESLLYVARSGALGGGVGAGVGAAGSPGCHPPLNDDAWHRATLVLRPAEGSQELYADGALVARAMAGPEELDLAGVPHLLVGMPAVPGLAGGTSGGAAGPGASSPLLGQVAEVRAWGRALSGHEVHAWAWRRAGPGDGDGLAACWSLQEGAGSTCSDSGPRRVGDASLGGLPIPNPAPHPVDLPLAPQWPAWAGGGLGREPPVPAGAGAWNRARGLPAWGLSTAPLAGEAVPA